MSMTTLLRASRNGNGAATNGAGTLRAVGYARVSTDEQAEAGYSLPEQVELIEECCRQHGFALVEVILDDFTGKLLQRPGLNQVTELAEAGAFDVLVPVKLDRLARLNHLRRGYEDWLQDRGIEVHYVTQSFEPTASGRLQKGIMGEFAEHELEVIRERTMGGRLKKAKKRHVMPCRAGGFGYHQITNAEAAVIPEYQDRAGELVVVEAEASLVHAAFERYASGESVCSLQRWLIGTGTRPPQGQCWTRSSVRYMLNNEAYTGRAYYGKRACRMTQDLTATGSARVQYTPRPREEWVPISCPAIVSDSLFQAVQERLASNREALRGRPSTTWLLRGVVFCGQCITRLGRPRTCCGSRGKNGHRRYICRTVSPEGNDSCCGSGDAADRLEAAAREWLRRAAEPGMLARMERQRLSEEREKFGRPERVIPRTLEELADLDKEEEKIADLLLAGVSRAIVEKKLSAIHQQRGELQQRLTVARSQAARSAQPDDAARHAEAVAQRLKQRLDEAAADPALEQQLFRCFLTITLFPEGDREPQIELRAPPSLVF